MIKDGYINMNKSYDIIKKDLENLGVKRGDVLVVHSSLKSMGQVDGGAMTVISALLDTLGEEGTLIFPTFTYIPSYEESFYSNKGTPCCVGVIPETFRKLDGAIRTNHPTHSVALKGKLASQLIKDELLNDTPMGKYSVYQRLPEVGGKILMLGCPLGRNSFMHAMEEIVGVEYALKDHQEYTVIDENGKEYKRRIRRHNFGRPEGIIAQRYERAIDVLDKDTDYKVGLVHGAECVLYDSAILKEKATKKFKEDPLYFVDDQNGIYKNGCKTNL